jgi:hypothetical protein
MSNVHSQKKRSTDADDAAVFGVLVCSAAAVLAVPFVGIAIPVSIMAGKVLFAVLLGSL